MAAETPGPDQLAGTDGAAGQGVAPERRDVRVLRSVANPRRTRL